MDGWVDCPPVGLGVKGVGSKQMREVGQPQQPGENYCYSVGVGQLSLRPERLLLPRGVPPTRALAMLLTKSLPRPRSLGGAQHHV